MKPGSFIVIDGTDGSGKTTQLRLLSEFLASRSIPFETIDFPRYSEFWGAMVGRFLAGEFGAFDDVSPYLIQPYYMLDQAAAAPQINTWLHEGKLVLSNRYITSSMNHQVAKLKTQEEKDAFLAWLDQAGYGKLNMVREDLVINLHVPTNISIELARKSLHRKQYTNKRDIAEEHIEHQRNTEQQMIENCERFSHWELIECAPNGRLLPVEKIQASIVDVLRQKKIITV